jgi:predicted kinase
MRRATILVSGAPGAGKTTLATPLAAALGFTLLSKDTIKETLHDALAGPAGDLEWSRRLGGASMELLWTLARQSPRVVLEAPFRPHGDLNRVPIARLGGRLVEVYCQCPPAICSRRFAERAPRHPAHVLDRLSDGLLAEFDGPVGLGDLVTVDTTSPVDVGPLAARIRRLLARPAPGS